MSHNNPSSGPIVALIMCAGLGSRMLPFTRHIPKPCIPLLNIPLVAYSLERIQAAGIREVAINVHHLPEVTRNVVQSICDGFGLHLTVVFEPILLGSGGGIRNLYDAVGKTDADYLIMNADTLVDIDLNDVIRTHRSKEHQVTMVVAAPPSAPSHLPSPLTIRVPEPDYGTASGETSSPKVVRVRRYTSHDYRVTHAGNAANEMEVDYTGVQVISGDLLKRIPKGESDLIDALHGPLVGEGVVSAYLFSGFWVSVESPEILYHTTMNHLSQGMPFQHIRLGNSGRTPITVMSPGSFSDRAFVCGPLYCGLHVDVDPTAKVGPFVCMDGVHLMAGAHVERAVLYGVGRISGVWRQCVAMAGEVVIVESDE